MDSLFYDIHDDFLAPPLKKKKITPRPYKIKEKKHFKTLTKNREKTAMSTFYLNHLNWTAGSPFTKNIPIQMKKDSNVLSLKTAW